MSHTTSSIAGVRPQGLLARACVPSAVAWRGRCGAGANHISSGHWQYALPRTEQSRSTNWSRKRAPIHSQHTNVSESVISRSRPALTPPPARSPAPPLPVEQTAAQSVSQSLISRSHPALTPPPALNPAPPLPFNHKSSQFHVSLLAIQCAMTTCIISTFCVCFD